MSNPNLMPAGRYYVGDLCYVLGNVWDDVCDLMFPNGKQSNEIIYQLNNIKFASLSTAHGDGLYEDQFGNSYPVDAGLIGCVLINDISDSEANIDDGNVIDFEDDFEVYSDNGNLYFGNICIPTDFDEEDEYIDDDNE